MKSNEVSKTYDVLDEQSSSPWAALEQLEKSELQELTEEEKIQICRRILDIMTKLNISVAPNNSEADEVGETEEADEVGETEEIDEVGETEEIDEVGETEETGEVGETSTSSLEPLTATELGRMRPVDVVHHLRSQYEILAPSLDAHDQVMLQQAITDFPRKTHGEQMAILSHEPHGLSISNLAIKDTLKRFGLISDYEIDTNYGESEGYAESGEVGETEESGEVGETEESGEVGETEEIDEYGETEEIGEYGETEDYGESGDYNETGGTEDYGETGSYAESGEPKTAAQKTSSNNSSILGRIFNRRR